MNEEDFYKPILDKIYTVRSEEFEMIFHNEHEKHLKENQAKQKQDKLINVIQKYIDKGSEAYSEILSSFNDFENGYLKELDYWIEKYYKLGFCDAMKLKNEIKTMEGSNNE